MAATVGVDIGGTGVRAARVDGAGRLGAITRERLSERDPDAVIAAVCRAVAAVGPAGRIGVGVPGFVRDGVVLGSPNFPGWAGEPLRERLRDALGVPVAVENDANCAALGAWARRGASEDLVLITLGTGVGGGVVTDGRLLRGAGGTGAEIGHIYAGGERACACGGVGCLETWCGTVGLLGRARALGHEPADGAALIAAARRGEGWAEALLDEAGRALGRGLVTLVNLFNPDVVLIAGGLTAGRDRIAPIAEGWLGRYGVDACVERVRVVWDGSAEGLAILGAARAVEALDV